MYDAADSTSKLDVHWYARKFKTASLAQQQHPENTRRKFLHKPIVGVIIQMTDEALVPSVQ
jgi:hypothetical protein